MLGTEEGNRLGPKMLMAVERAVNHLDRKMPTGEATVDDHLGPTMLMDPGDRWSLKHWQLNEL